jgi:ParB-like chromosome segregation protein Spo0J
LRNSFQTKDQIMTDIAEITANAETIEISADRLVAATNIRHQIDRKDIDSMKISILSTGVLQNLLGAERKADDKIVIFGGLTRLTAIFELISEGKMSNDFPVSVKIYHGLDAESADAIAIAVTENVIRADMDYVDECAAMFQLAEARWSTEEIADKFGYRAKTVHERLLIAKLIPDALVLVRAKTRTLSWAHALTIADKSMQKQICDDVSSNPGAWATGEDIRKFLTKATVPAENAIFDMADYSGEIVSDFFDGDKLSDLEQFWTLQNKAIDDLRVEVEAEGYRDVEITREPFASWQYDDEADVSKASAFIEVMPNGTVSVIRGKVAMEDLNTKIRSLDAADVENSTQIDEIADYEVRATPTICEYAAAQRSAMVQAEMASNMRAALEYSVIAMIGHRSASFAAQAYSMPGQTQTHIGKAFDTIAGVASDVYETIDVDGEPDVREAEVVAMVRSMDDRALNVLFTQLVSQRAGQTRRRAVDNGANSLMNTFGGDIDVRAWWTPDETFFDLMSTEDLRRLATALLHAAGASSTRFASSKKKDLVRALSSNFADARDGALSGEIARSLNAWTPGVMSFPAEIEMKSQQDDIFDEADEDIDALLFGDEAAA